ncbi:hypothetical protein [Streptomyces tendae]
MLALAVVLPLAGCATDSGSPDTAPSASGSSAVGGGTATAAPEVRAQLRVDGDIRQYLLHRPLAQAADGNGNRDGNGDGDGPKPLLIAFHGRGADAAELRAKTRLERAATARGMLVAFPEGLGHGWGGTRACRVLRLEHGRRGFPGRARRALPGAPGAPGGSGAAGSRALSRARSAARQPRDTPAAPRAQNRSRPAALPHAVDVPHAPGRGVGGSRRAACRAGVVLPAAGFRARRRTRPAGLLRAADVPHARAWAGSPPVVAARMAAVLLAAGFRVRRRPDARAGFSPAGPPTSSGPARGTAARR